MKAGVCSRCGGRLVPDKETRAAIPLGAPIYAVDQAEDGSMEMLCLRCTEDADDWAKCEPPMHLNEDFGNYPDAGE